MEEILKAGDVVQLKSGGQKMTIENIDEPEAECVWFDGGIYNERHIALVVLKKYEAPENDGLL